MWKVSVKQGNDYYFCDVEIEFGHLKFERDIVSLHKNENNDTCVFEGRAQADGLHHCASNQASPGLFIAELSKGELYFVYMQPGLGMEESIGGEETKKKSKVVKSLFAVFKRFDFSKRKFETVTDIELRKKLTSELKSFPAVEEALREQSLENFSCPVLSEYYRKNRLRKTVFQPSNALTSSYQGFSNDDFNDDDDDENNNNNNNNNNNQKNRVNTLHNIKLDGFKVYRYGANKKKNNVYTLHDCDSNQGDCRIFYLLPFEVESPEKAKRIKQAIECGAIVISTTDKENYSIFLQIDDKQVIVKKIDDKRCELIKSIVGLRPFNQGCEITITDKKIYQQIDGIVDDIAFSFLKQRLVKDAPLFPGKQSILAEKRVQSYLKDKYAQELERVIPLYEKAVKDYTYRNTKDGPLAPIMECFHHYAMNDNGCLNENDDFANTEFSNYRKDPFKEWTLKSKQKIIGMRERTTYLFPNVSDLPADFRPRTLVEIFAYLLRREMLAIASPPELIISEPERTTDELCVTRLRLLLINDLVTVADSFYLTKCEDRRLLKAVIKIIQYKLEYYCQQESLSEAQLKKSWSEIFAPIGNYMVRTLGVSKLIDRKGEGKYIRFKAVSTMFKEFCRIDMGRKNQKDLANYFQLFFKEYQVLSDFKNAPDKVCLDDNCYKDLLNSLLCVKSSKDRAKILGAYREFFGDDDIKKCCDFMMKSINIKLFNVNETEIKLPYNQKVEKKEIKEDELTQKEIMYHMESYDHEEFLEILEKCYYAILDRILEIEKSKNKSKDKVESDISKDIRKIRNKRMCYYFVRKYSEKYLQRAHTTKYDIKFLVRMFRFVKFYKLFSHVNEKVNALQSETIIVINKFKKNVDAVLKEIEALDEALQNEAAIQKPKNFSWKWSSDLLDSQLHSNCCILTLQGAWVQYFSKFIKNTVGLESKYSYSDVENITVLRDILEKFFKVYPQSDCSGFYSLNTKIKELKQAVLDNWKSKKSLQKSLRGGNILECYGKAAILAENHEKDSENDELLRNDCAKQRKNNINNQSINISLRIADSKEEKDEAKEKKQKQHKPKKMQEKNEKIIVLEVRFKEICEQFLKNLLIFGVLKKDINYTITTASASPQKCFELRLTGDFADTLTDIITKTISNFAPSAIENPKDDAVLSSINGVLALWTKLTTIYKENYGYLDVDRNSRIENELDEFIKGVLNVYHKEKRKDTLSAFFREKLVSLKYTKEILDAPLTRILDKLKENKKISILFEPDLQSKSCEVEGFFLYKSSTDNGAYGLRISVDVEINTFKFDSNEIVKNHKMRIKHQIILDRLSGFDDSFIKDVKRNLTREFKKYNNNCKANLKEPLQPDTDIQISDDFIGIIERYCRSNTSGIMKRIEPLQNEKYLKAFCQKCCHDYMKVLLIATEMAGVNLSDACCFLRIVVQDGWSNSHIDSGLDKAMDVEKIRKYLTDKNVPLSCKHQITEILQAHDLRVQKITDDKRRYSQNSTKEIWESLALNDSNMSHAEKVNKHGMLSQNNGLKKKELTSFEDFEKDVKSFFEKIQDGNNKFDQFMQFLKDDEYADLMVLGYELIEVKKFEDSLLFTDYDHGSNTSRTLFEYLRAIYGQEILDSSGPTNEISAINDSKMSVSSPFKAEVESNKLDINLAQDRGNGLINNDSVNSNSDTESNLSPKMKKIQMSYAKMVNTHGMLSQNNGLKKKEELTSFEDFKKGHGCSLI